MSNHAIWCDRYWSDISNQLLRLDIIDKAEFDGSLLKKDTTNGAWLWSWLGRVYEQHSYTARQTATIEVIAPGYGSNSCWTLRLEVRVRKRQTNSFATFPEAFGLHDTTAGLAPGPASEEMGSLATTSGGEL